MRSDKLKRLKEVYANLTPEQKEAVRQKTIKLRASGPAYLLDTLEKHFPQWAKP